MLATMVLTAAALKWRAPRATSNQSSTPVVPGRAALAGVPRGLGAGPPPEGAARGGARMVHRDPRHTHPASGSAPTSPPVVSWGPGGGRPSEGEVAPSPDARAL